MRCESTLSEPILCSGACGLSVSWPVRDIVSSTPCRALWLTFSANVWLTRTMFITANHEENIHRITVWQNSATWNADTAQSLLLNVHRNKGQTNEARDQAGLILSWIELRKDMALSRKSRLMRQQASEKRGDGDIDNDDDEDDKNDGGTREASRATVAKKSTLPIADISPDGMSLKTDCDRDIISTSIYMLNSTCRIINNLMFMKC